ncbi:(2Fe-2S)-binding protein [Sediminibacillus massiliensis]|uniref:(2Fe-2S)-binding protein n=1 Tax=Sediminibacillus massiliensis TaxID=1926277 RepID=UPI0009884D47|nr:(2Fe-2S)-binding protein [Sediminibacillus massiliensis]
MEHSKTVSVQAGAVSKIAISFTLNQKCVELHVSPTLRLVDILRDELKVTGTKISCGIGRCGACSVLMDGMVINSCLLMAYQVDNAEITTIEGLKRDSELDLIQQAFLEEGGFQCGYCTSGMIMAVKSLLDENLSPSDEEIKEHLSGNLCRCTGYGGIIRAVKRLSEQRK